ncbi:MAG: aminotransferase class III-fold pyridoxal phosphate-dependent enzyme, partial [Planctomycetota bacterium]|nr:aminotransferase class III-fold pyridoxal phosphate-dependent enzyme [Planctomycetota bacterium]
MQGTTLASTVCESDADSVAILATCDELIRNAEPNLFRLCVNRHVAQACFLLSRCVVRQAPGAATLGEYPIFLANSGEEALSGAIKLARYAANLRGRDTSGEIYDPDGRWQHFAATPLANGESLQFVPGVFFARDAYELASWLSDRSAAPAFIVAPHTVLAEGQSSLVDLLCSDESFEDRPLLISVLLADDVAERRKVSRVTPDIVVFDESFVNHDVPFGAFAARPDVYELWTRKGMTTFHSTTYQPNSVSTRHLVKCFEQNFPGFTHYYQDDVDRMARDPAFCRVVFSRLFSRQLASLARATGFSRATIRAEGHYVTVGKRRVFDGVAGVACSLRGHNPQTFVDEVQQTGSLDDCRQQITARLTDMTGLAHWRLAVSGASAVEQALKLGLACQTPRDHVLVLQGGFGGKTLFALTGTSKPTLRAGLGPLYPHVVYVDPFASDAVSQIEAAFCQYPIGVIQAELIQGVGGVRALPLEVVECLQRMQHAEDCLLFIDEVQTGMFRTGPFIRCSELGVEPDLLTLGKGTSDMMIPSGMTLYSDGVADRLRQRGCSIAKDDAVRSDSGIALRVIANTLQRTRQEHLPEQVEQAGARFVELLGREL